MSLSLASPAGSSNAFSVWLWVAMGRSGSGEVGTNARRLFSFLHVWEDIICWTVEVIKYYTCVLHDCGKRDGGGNRGLK